MLPFLDPKKAAGSIMSVRKGKRDLEAKIEVEAPGSEMDPGLKTAAEDLMRAIEGKSVIDVANALKSAFIVCDAMPHIEGEHEDAE